MPVAETLKVAVIPCCTVLLAGWVAIAGATGAAVTVRVAALEVALLAVGLVTTT